LTGTQNDLVGWNELFLPTFVHDPKTFSCDFFILNSMGRASARPEASPAAALPPAPAPPASLQVESRPTGAQVWIDGRLVGTTPLQLSSVETGSHALRLELPGYRPWTTSVSVSRGARARVAASLEQ
jgi:hypothetical protein